MNILDLFACLAWGYALSQAIALSGLIMHDKYESYKRKTRHNKYLKGVDEQKRNGTYKEQKSLYYGGVYVSMTYPPCNEVIPNK